ncbi:hypothetical protein VE04_09492 [Pseudogymnoascus sp. 24MN13]|nr:hypothetical protein VE04_09492 [Pseudogymnoascus sp. 24MN13]
MSRLEQVVVVLGTREGKSLLFMLPCMLPDAGITILILPLTSTPSGTRTAPLVFVSAEAAGTKAFRAYAYRLAATGELGRIVLDEAHFTVTASEYRAAMVDLALVCRTKEDAAALAGLLRCPLYAADVGIAERKGELLRTWLLSPNQLHIVATSALSAGFDYAHVRLVIHMDEHVVPRGRRPRVQPG